MDKEKAGPETPEPKSKHKSKSKSKNSVKKEEKRNSKNPEQQPFDGPDFFRPDVTEDEKLQTGIRTGNSGRVTDEEIQQLGAMIDNLDPVFWDSGSDGKDQSGYPERNHRDMFGTEPPEMMSQEMMRVSPETAKPEVDHETREKETTPTTLSVAPTTSKAAEKASSFYTPSPAPETSSVSSGNQTVDSDLETDKSNQTSTSEHISEIAKKIWVRSIMK